MQRYPIWHVRHTAPYSSLTDVILANRSLTLDRLSDSPDVLNDPYLMRDMDRMVARILQAIREGERIVVLSLDSADERRFLTVPANAQWAPDGRSLLFRLAGNLYRQPVPGGPQVQLTRFTPELIFSFAVSADQKQWALVRGQVVSDVVLVTQRQER